MPSGIDRQRVLNSSVSYSALATSSNFHGFCIDRMHDTAGSPFHEQTHECEAPGASLIWNWDDTQNVASPFATSSEGSSAQLSSGALSDDFIPAIIRAIPPRQTGEEVRVLGQCRAR